MREAMMSRMEPLAHWNVSREGAPPGAAAAAAAVLVVVMTVCVFTPHAVRRAFGCGGGSNWCRPGAAAAPAAAPAGREPRWYPSWWAMCVARCEAEVDVLQEPHRCFLFRPRPYGILGSPDARCWAWDCSCNEEDGHAPRLGGAGVCVARHRAQGARASQVLGLYFVHISLVQPPVI